MQSARVALVAFIVLLAFASAPAMAQEVKIATANPAVIFNQMQETKDLKVKIENDRKALEAQEREKREKITSLQSERDQLKSDTPQYGERNKALLQAAIEFKSWGEIMQSDMQRQQKVQMKSLFEKIQSATSEVAKSKGITLVLAEQRPEVPENLDQVTVDQLRILITQRNVLFAGDGIDISNDIIALLDSRYKK